MSTLSLEQWEALLSPGWLVTQLRLVHSQADWASIEDGEEPWLDVRLRAFDGDADLLTGDPSFDIEHRGAWASGVMTSDCDDDELRALADELIAEVLDALADEQPLLDGYVHCAECGNDTMACNEPAPVLCHDCEEPS